MMQMPVRHVVTELLEQRSNAVMEIGFPRPDRFQPFAEHQVARLESRQGSSAELRCEPYRSVDTAVDAYERGADWL
jgi:hypothetical protein